MKFKDRVYVFPEPADDLFTLKFLTDFTLTILNPNIQKRVANNDTIRIL